jgi:hypothetical protein
MCFKKNSCEIGGARDTSWAYQHIWALESPPAQPNQQCPTGLEGKLWASVGLTSSSTAHPRSRPRDICDCASLKHGFRSFAIMQFGFANLPFSDIAILLQCLFTIFLLILGFLHLI